MHFTERERTHTHQAFYRERAHAHTILRERERAHTHTIFTEAREREHTHRHTIYFTERERAHTPYILQERRQSTTHSYAHIHTAIINRKYSMQSACASPSSITAANPLQQRRSKVRAPHLRQP
jgi:hypothetical protein